jgi:hypothetical protein
LRDAPPEYREHFPNVDADDWLVHVHVAQGRGFIPWLAGRELCGHFGVTTRSLPDGSELRVATATTRSAYR